MSPPLVTQSWTFFPLALGCLCGFIWRSCLFSPQWSCGQLLSFLSILHGPRRNWVMFLELFPLPLPSLGSTLMLSLTDVCLFSYTLSLQKRLGVFRVTRREAASCMSGRLCLEESLLLQASGYSSLWILGTGQQLLWILWLLYMTWVQNSNCLWNSWPSICPRGPLFCHKLLGITLEGPSGPRWIYFLPYIPSWHCQDHHSNCKFRDSQSSH